MSCSKGIQKNEKSISSYSNGYNCLIQDSLGIPSSRTLIVSYENGSEKLYLQNDIVKSIESYELKSKNLVKRIHLDGEGDRANIDYWGFYVIDKDSILLTTSPSRVSLINGEGLIIHTLDLIEDLTFSSPPISYSRYGSIGIKRSNGISLIQSFARQHFSSDLLFEGDYHFSYHIDNDLKSISKNKIHHPDDYLDIQIRDMLVSQTYDTKQTVYSPVFDHNLYLSHNEDVIDSIVMCGTENIRSFMDAPILPGKKDILHELIIHGQYLGIYYDKFRNLYYRTYWPGINDDEINVLYFTNEFADYVKKSYPRMGILVMSSDFNVLGDFLLENFRYNVHECFVSKEGLNISIHYNNEDIEEGLYCFEVFDFSGLR